MDASGTTTTDHKEEVKSPQGCQLGDTKLNLIQIKAVSEEEVNRRIYAFIRNKRNEVNERNIREFISPFSSEPETSCARVEAVYIHREGQKSHISLKKVDNSSGPQTLLPADEDDDRDRLLFRVPVEIQRAEAVEERLSNLEAHLNVKSDSQDIFARIKSLENRVSFLEGLSPEYFIDGIPEKKKRLEHDSNPYHVEDRLISGGDIKQDENLSDINMKIRHLKQVLKEKAINGPKQGFDPAVKKKMTTKIFLGNLSSDTTADKLRPLFEKYGEVVECDVLKNFGFVHMTNKGEANKAIAQLDGYSVDGNNIRVELSTGKRGSGGGKFDKKGFGGAGRSRPYGMSGRGDFGRYLPPLPPVGYDRYDPYYRYYLDREAYYARLGALGGDRGYPSTTGRDRYPLPRDRLADRYAADPRDRVAAQRSYIDDRGARGPQADPYFRERDPLAARPPPEYYDRKPPAGGRADPSGAVGTGRGSATGGYGNGVGGGDFYQGGDRVGAGLAGAAGGSDYYRHAGAGQGGYGRPGLGGLGGKLGDNQSSFDQDNLFF